MKFEIDGGLHDAERVCFLLARYAKDWILRLAPDEGFRVGVTRPHQDMFLVWLSKTDDGRNEHGGVLASELNYIPMWRLDELARQCVSAAYSKWNTPAEPVTLPEPMSSDWDTKAEWMRRMGATAATWDSQSLTSLALGPVPGEPLPAPQPVTHAEAAERILAERQRVASLAASGFTRRADHK